MHAEGGAKQVGKSIKKLGEGRGANPCRKVGTKSGVKPIHMMFTLQSQGSSGRKFDQKKTHCSGKLFEFSGKLVLLISLQFLLLFLLVVTFVIYFLLLKGEGQLF